MLELRTNCENCDCHLAPESLDAMMCSYECTFCKSCVETLLNNVCPNCGGGFCPRPIRPKKTWVSGTGLEFHPTTEKRVFKPLDKNKHQQFSGAIKNILPNLR